MRPQPTTTELRAAFDRVKPLRFRGWTFERALASPLLRISIVNSARAHRDRLEAQYGAALPVQPTLI